MTSVAIPAYTLGLSEFTTQPWTFDRDVERYSAHGLGAIEVVEAKLDDDRWAEQMAGLPVVGLAISGVQPAVRTFFASRMQAEPKALEDRVARLRASIERLGRYAPGAPFITNTGAHPRGDMDEAMRVVARELKALAPVAADHGVRLALEPLNPSSVNVESAVWTIDQALAVIEATGREEVGLCLDYWNIWQNADVEAAVRRAGDRIFTVQASDWRTPRSFADRLAPGEGSIPLSRLIAATREAGFTGPYVVEIFSQDVDDSLWAGDLDALIDLCRCGMDAAWNGSMPPAHPPQSKSAPDR